MNDGDLIDEASAGKPRWKVYLGLLFGAAIFAFALYTIRSKLGELTIEEVMAGLQSLPPSSIGFAIAATAISYLGAAMFDVFALNYTSAHVPFRQAMFSGFSAYATSNTVGMPLLTGNALRYRLYSGWGLKGGDVAVFAVATAMMLITGGLIVASAGLLFMPAGFARVSSLPSWALFGVGVVCILVVAGILIRSVTGPKVRRIRGVELRKASPMQAIGQTMAGIIDWSFAALVLYILLPNSVDIPFAVFATVYVTATLLGGISGIPGGVGVFEAAMLLLLPQGFEAQVAASLIAYRFIYFLLPLGVAAVMLALQQANALRESGTSRSQKIRNVTGRSTSIAFAAITFVTGILMLASAATPSLMPRMDVVSKIVPLRTIEVSHFVASIVGFMLLIVAVGLHRRLRNAWILAIILLIMGLVFTYLKGGTFQEIGVKIAVLIVMFSTRRVFYRRAPLRDLQIGWAGYTLIIGSLGAILWLGLFSFKNVEFRDGLWWDVSLSGDLARFIRAGAGISVVALMLGVWRFIRPSLHHKRTPSSREDLVRVKDILQTAEGARPEASLALLGDKQFLFSKSGKSFIMYGVKGRNWFALGGPIGLRSERQELLHAFCELADLWDAWPSFYGVREEAIDDYKAIDFHVEKVGEFASVNIENCELAGKQWAKFRQARNRCLREDCTFDVIAADDVPRITDRLKDVSNIWLNRQSGKEKGFTLGRFDEEFIAHGPVAVAYHEGEIKAFATLWSNADNTVLAMDLMRFDPNTPVGIMDYLFAELMLWGGANGYSTFDLGMVPLSGLDAVERSNLMVKIGDLVYRKGGKLYDFGGLRQFKNKFKPEWESRYLAAPTILRLSISLGTLVLLSSGGFRSIFQRSSN